MKKFLESAKAFDVMYENYYAETSVKPYYKESIMVGFYYENNGTEGEFRLEWNNGAIILIAYDDSWEALSKMPELIELLAEIDRSERKEVMSVNEFAERLLALGYKDITQRVEPAKQNPLIEVNVTG